jgi:hypothetical protein
MHDDHQAHHVFVRATLVVRTHFGVHVLNRFRKSCKYSHHLIVVDVIATSSFTWSYLAVPLLAVPLLHMLALVCVAPSGAVPTGRSMQLPGT